MRKLSSAATSGYGPSAAPWDLPVCPGGHTRMNPKLSAAG